MRRRNLLAFLGGSLSVAAAGCIGDSDDSQDGAEDEGEDENDTAEADRDPAEFAVGIAESNSPVEAGEVLEISAGVTNIGEESGEETIPLTISDVGTVDQVTVDLAGGDSAEITLEWNTTEGDSGDYSAEIRSGDDSDITDITVEASGPEYEADEVVHVVSNAFEPDLVQVDPGDSVLWIAEEEGGDHTVTFYHEDASTQHRVPRGVEALDETIGTTDGVSFEFTESGVYTYYCRPHEGQGMVGAIIVGDDDDPFQPGLSAPDETLPAEATSAIEDLSGRARDVLGIDPDEAVEEIEITAFPDAFDPEIVELSPGAEVTWVAHTGDDTGTEDENGEENGDGNDDGDGDETLHTVTFYHEDNNTQHRVPEGVEAIDEELEMGSERTVVVEEPGVYDYYSRGSEEAGTVGSLVVGEADDPTQPGLTEPEGLPAAAAERIEFLNQQAITILGIPTVSEAVVQANAVIEVLNTDEEGSIATINASLEHMEGVDPIAPVEADSPVETAQEADRLREEVDRLTSEIFTQVPEEINIESQERSGIELLGAAGTPPPEEIETPDDAREAADALPSLGADVEEAADALRATADIADAIDEQLHWAADLLDGTIPDS